MRPLPPATIRKIHYLISGAYHRALRWHWIDHSPTSEADSPPKPHPEPQPPTPAEASQIVHAAWAHPDLSPLVWLAMVTDARRGELCALRWRHVDATRRILVIRASIAQVGAETWERTPSCTSVAISPSTLTTPPCSRLTPRATAQGSAGGSHPHSRQLCVLPPR